MDQIDRRILTELQHDAALPIAALAGRVGLSQTPCWKRVQKLEAAGVILGRRALVDAGKLGLGLTVFVEIVAQDHGADWRKLFLETVTGIPNVMDVFRLGGSADYLLRVVAPDMKSYDAIYQTLTAAVPMRSVTSRFVMEHIRARPSLPELSAGAEET